MYRKYFVYTDNGGSCCRLAVAAVSDDTARAYGAEYGEVVAVKDVTEEFHINKNMVRDELLGWFSNEEVDWICGVLEKSGIVE